MFKQVGLGGLTLAHLDLNKGNLLLIHKEKFITNCSFTKGESVIIKRVSFREKNGQFYLGKVR